ncbi:DUF4290 domain-containing protein [Chondrinema litorale]|uniref:DUF4290 domain-containing protein n=1 Tax=Chondrinema litorale TaxID=2994555 RepID=UPI002543578B|nr:DUF4290 domain-containing protein [Chondrinema litorale]UZR92406.1 DUF4290 domain-containing protein [Chondrinema litorale]
MEYNSQREPLILMEYGRNVQKLVRYIRELDDKEERSRLSHVLIHLMKQLNPSVRENSDNVQRIWDHLHIMADFTLDIEAPYPTPDESIVFAKPQKMEYKSGELKFKHYGRNIDLLISRAIALEDETEKNDAIIYIGKLMKSFYASWNKENISDDVIIRHLYELSDRKIDYRDKVKSDETLFNISNFKDKSNDRHDHSDRRSRNNNNSGKRRSRRRR